MATISPEVPYLEFQISPPVPRLHIAPVSCVTSALDNSIVISGSEDSSIIISSLETGKLVSSTAANEICRMH